MTDIVWIEAGGDDEWYLRVRATGEHPTGRVAVLSMFRSLHDDASIAEIDEIVADWGWRRTGVLYVDEMGKTHVPVAPSA